MQIAFQCVAPSESCHVCVSCRYWTTVVHCLSVQPLVISSVSTLVLTTRSPSVSLSMTLSQPSVNTLNAFYHVTSDNLYRLAVREFLCGASATDVRNLYPHCLQTGTSMDPVQTHGSLSLMTSHQRGLHTKCTANHRSIRIHPGDTG